MQEVKPGLRVMAYPTNFIKPSTYRDKKVQTVVSVVWQNLKKAFEILLYLGLASLTVMSVIECAPLTFITTLSIFGFLLIKKRTNRCDEALKQNVKEDYQYLEECLKKAKKAIERGSIVTTIDQSSDFKELAKNIDPLKEILDDLCTDIQRHLFLELRIDESKSYRLCSMHKIESKKTELEFFSNLVKTIDSTSFNAMKELIKGQVDSLQKAIDAQIRDYQKTQKIISNMVF